MNIVRSLKPLSDFSSGTVVSIGNFDGMHRGHEVLLSMVEHHAAEKALPAVLLTFEPQPQEYFSQAPAARLMRFREKYEFLKERHLDYLVPLRFNRALASRSAESFVRDILCEILNVRCLVVGNDFRFGANRLGDVALLRTLGKQYGFEVLCVSEHIEDDERVSSTRIRELLSVGAIAQANRLLGHAYTISGRVVHGDKRGRTLGFPTANIPIRRACSPVSGVFAVTVQGLSDDPLPGVASVGRQPMFNGQSVLLEVFIFDFDKMIYGEFISVTLYQKLRDQEKYPDVDTLIGQMHKDARLARDYFRS